MLSETKNKLCECYTSIEISKKGWLFLAMNNTIRKIMLQYCKQMTTNDCNEMIAMQ